MLPKLINDDNEEEFKLPETDKTAMSGTVLEKRKYLSLKLKCPSRHKSSLSAPEKPNRVRRYNINKDYEIGRKLGIGSYSQVFAGIDKKSGLEVALKKCKGKTNIMRLQQEFNLLQRFSHESIPKVYDLKIDQATNTGYMIMEYFDGVPADEFISTHGGIEHKAVVECIYNLLDTIHYLHSKGVVHRDVKPQNVLINSSLNIKLIDFNISKIVEPSTISGETRFSMMSFKLITQVGSPMFAAPEVYSKDCYSEKIDVWGVGIVLLHLVLSKEDMPDKFQDFESKSLNPQIEKFLHNTL